ncbi:MAG: ATPase [Micrococcales bacterium]|nr:MAG: ATPase [Micrococcales bacterium]
MTVVVGPGDPSHTSDPSQWGRVDTDGTVYVRTADGERSVGSYPHASEADALAYFGHKYDEIVSMLDLAEQRLALPDPPVKEVGEALEQVKVGLPEVNVVGDLTALEARVDALLSGLQSRREEAAQAKARAREEAKAARQELVAEAEKIAATDPQKMQWRPAGDRMKELFEAWKAAQSGGPRLNKADEDELWKRFSHARNSFDRARRTFFSKLHSEQDAAKAAKKKLVAQAEDLSTSTDWRGTSAAYRDLMTQWKQAGRASRKDDDALWARFRAAQDAFFAARSAKQAEQDQEFAANLVKKEELLAQAEALLPVKNVGAAKATLRSVHERWDQVGKVPRSALSGVERRLRAVEQAVRDAEQDKWRRGNPETQARASSALDQLDKSIADLQRDLRTAKESGDQRAVKEAKEALDTKRAWREQIAKLSG